MNLEWVFGSTAAQVKGALDAMSGGTTVHFKRDGNVRQNKDGVPDANSFFAGVLVQNRFTRSTPNLYARLDYSGTGKRYVTENLGSVPPGGYVAAVWQLPKTTVEEDLSVALSETPEFSANLVVSSRQKHFVPRKTRESALRVEALERLGLHTRKDETFNVVSSEQRRHSAAPTEPDSFKMGGTSEPLHPSLKEAPHEAPGGPQRSMALPLAALALGGVAGVAIGRRKKGGTKK